MRVFRVEGVMLGGWVDGIVARVRLFARMKVSRWTASVDISSGTYSCPASMSARLVMHLRTWDQFVPGADLSWRARSLGRCHGLTGLVLADGMVDMKLYKAQSL